MARIERRRVSQMRRRSFGAANRKLEPRLAAVLCYLLGIITGIILLTVERENRFVRFHALQSILYCAVAVVVLAGLAMAELYSVSALLGLASMALWLFLMYRAARGERFQLPWLGTWAEHNA
jgi:uncharacterized membrane protein